MILGRLRRRFGTRSRSGVEHGAVCQGRGVGRCMENFGMKDKLMMNDLRCLERTKDCAKGSRGVESFMEQVTNRTCFDLYPNQMGALGPEIKVRMSPHSMIFCSDAASGTPNIVARSRLKFGRSLYIYRNECFTLYLYGVLRLPLKSATAKRMPSVPCATVFHFPVYAHRKLLYTHVRHLTSYIWNGCQKSSCFLRDRPCN